MIVIFPQQFTEIGHESGMLNAALHVDGYSHVFVKFCSVQLLGTHRVYGTLRFSMFMAHFTALYTHLYECVL